MSEVRWCWIHHNRAYDGWPSSGWSFEDDGLDPDGEYCFAFMLEFVDADEPCVVGDAVVLPKGEYLRIESHDFNRRYSVAVAIEEGWLRKVEA